VRATYHDSAYLRPTVYQIPTFECGAGPNTENKVLRRTHELMG
jgi:hypothetical protein